MGKIISNGIDYTGGGPSTLSGLSDVSLTTPVIGDALIYDGAEWVNTPISGSAHTIIDESGTSLADEPGLQFLDARLADDNVNGVTTVEIVHQLTKAQLDLLGSNTDGIYETTDESDSSLTADYIGYDNTASGMASSDVQNAIDEIATTFLSCVRVFRFSLTNGTTYDLSVGVAPHLAMLVGTSSRGGVYFFGNSVCQPLWVGDNRLTMTYVSNSQFTVKQTANSSATLYVISMRQNEVITCTPSA